MSDASLSEGLAALCQRPVAPADRARAALHVRDWLACAIAATTLPVAGILAGAARGLPGMADPWAEVLYTGALGTLLEMDDIDRAALCHPGPVIVPAALHTARQLGLPGSALLAAIVRGYEAAIRVGRACGPGHYAHFHPTATCGVLGAAVAAYALLQAAGRVGAPTTQGARPPGGRPLPPVEPPDARATAGPDLASAGMVHAIGLAATRAAGLWQVRLESCGAKPWHTAHAAQTGIQAALQAAAGVTAPRHILEGSKGFFAALAPDGEPARVLIGPDGPWRLHETSFKPWPACRHTHPAIQATLWLRERAAREGTPAIASLQVATYGDALDFCDCPHPADTAQARFSLQHTVATAWLHGAPRLEHFGPQALADPAVRALRERIVLARDPDLDMAYPAHFGASVSARLAHGHHWHCRTNDAPGDPEQPLDEAALRAKLMDACASAKWSDMRVAALLSTLTDLDARPGAMGLAPLLAPAEPAQA